MAKINLSSINNLQNESSVTATINTNNALITEAVENSISRDGTQPNQMNSVLDMNSNPIINLPDALTDQEPVTYSQYLDGITSVNNGVVVDGDFVVLAHNDTMTNDRLLTAGENLQIIDGGAKGNVEVRVDNPQLNSIASLTSEADKLPYFTGSGTADLADFTPFARQLVDDPDASTMRNTLGVSVGGDVQPHSDLLDSLNSSGTGIVTKTTPDTITPRTITGTSNEINVTNGDGVTDNPTISLPSSLAFTGKTVTDGTFSSPNITTPTGIVKGDVGLGNVDNTSDATKNAASATLTNKTISGSANTLSNISNASLSSAADSTLKSNISGSSASPSDNTITAVLDKQFGSTQGSVVYRGASSWSALTPGTSGNFLKTQGAAANPVWSAVPGGGDLLSTNNLSDLANVSTARDNLKTPRKNYIVNGSMMVSQENLNTAGTTSNYYPVDQFFISLNSAGAVSVAQVSSVTPAGSPNRIRTTVTSTDTSIAAGEFVFIIQNLEANNIADLRIGTASAKTFTLSFGVKAPAGTYCVGFRNSANNRSYVAEYTITGGEANTDVIKSVTVPGDTTGTWATGSNLGLSVVWTLSAGSTYQTTPSSWAAGSYFASTNQFNLMGTNGNVFELFDVGLYEGTRAPDFVIPEYASEYQRCQRYYCKSFPSIVKPAQNAGPAGALTAVAATASPGSISFRQYWPVIMRTSPTIITYNPSANNANWYDVNGAASRTAATAEPIDNSMRIVMNAASTAGSQHWVHWTANARM